MKRFRAGLIGVGDNALPHLAVIKNHDDVELIGVTDLDRKRNFAAAEAWNTIAFNNLDQLVDSGANVIHILARPHAKLALAALERNCHVMIEKPVTEDEDEAIQIGKLAREKGLIVTVDHSLLYESQIKRALDVVRAGELGDVSSVEMFQRFTYPTYEGGPLPPWYRGAGYPFRDLGTECLYVLQALLGDIENVEVECRALGNDPNLAFDDWHAEVRCGRGVGRFQIGHDVEPTLILHGTKQVLRVDLFTERDGSPVYNAAHRVLGGAMKSIAAPRALEELGRGFATTKLVHAFYHRLAAGGPPVVSIHDAARIVKWVEQFARAADAEYAEKLAQFSTAAKVPFLVTGASGSLGRATVARLLAEGHTVRVFVRRIPERPQPNVEYVFGNLGDPEAVGRAVAGAETVIHVGAAMKGDWAEHKGSTIAGTENVITSARKHGVKQLVYISSMSVVDWAGSTTVNEAAKLEPRPEERGAYTRAKLAAEQLVTAAAKAGLPAVILRPGQIFGGGIPLINGAVARHARGRWIVLGDGKLELPLVYIDDVVDAIMNAIGKRLTHGEVIQIIDPEHLTQADVLSLAGKTKVLRVPRPLLFALGRLSELPFRMLGRQSPVAVYRLKSALARLHYESDRAHALLGWEPRVGVREGIKRVSS
jgi:nucleoside-diphosphate-sugar epimerase/predicted dehydrogenase